MKELSIFSLIRIVDQSTAQEELTKRYEVYHQLESCQLIINSKLLKSFFKKLHSFLEKKELNPADFENYADKLTQLSFEDFKEYEDDLFEFIDHKNSPYILNYLLKECKTFSSIYLLLYLSYFLDSKQINNEFYQTIKEYCQIIYFSKHATFIIRSHKSYPALHYKTYFAFNTYKNKVDLYLDFPDEYDQSLYYQLINNQPPLSKPVKKHKVTKNDLERFDLLLKKYLKPLLSYQQVKDCITNFDNFFAKQSDMLYFLNYFITHYRIETDNHQVIIDFFLLLFCKTNEYNTLKFTIAFMHFLSNNEINKRLFKTISFLAQYQELTKYCCMALLSRNNAQAIFRKLFKNNPDSIKYEIMPFFDLLDDKSFFSILKELKYLHLKPSFLLNLIENSNILTLLSEKNLTSNQVNNIAELIIQNTFHDNFSKYSKAYQLIYNLYNNYYDLLKHPLLLTISLINYCNKYSNNQNLKISNLIINKLNYEDDITFIDEQLNKEDFSIFEMLVMMHYYQYFPKTILKELIIKDYLKYHPFLIFFNESDQELIKDLLDFFDQNLTIENSHLSLDYTFNAEEENEIIEEQSLLTYLANFLSFYPTFYYHIYEIGIHYFSDKIRVLFYENIANLYDLNLLSNDEINFVSRNIFQEENESTLKIIENVFLPCKNLIN